MGDRGGHVQRSRNLARRKTSQGHLGLVLRSKELSWQGTKDQKGRRGITPNSRCVKKKEEVNREDLERAREI